MSGTFLWAVIVLVACMGWFGSRAAAAAGQGAGGETPPAALPKDVDPDSRSRFPIIRRDDMDEFGKKIYDLYVGPQTQSLLGLRGPLGTWLYSPRVAEPLQMLNNYVRFQTDLGPRLTELAILVTARELSNQFEWAQHEPVALKEGLEPAIADVVKYRRSPDGLGEKESVIIRYGRELFREKKVRSDTFAQAVKLFGKQGVVNLTALMGYYTMTAMILDTVDFQLLGGQKAMLPMP